MAKANKPSGQALKVPIHIDPKTGKTLTYLDWEEGKVPELSVASLPPELKKKLIIARIKAQADFSFMDLNGNQLTQKEIITQIKNDAEVGNMYVENDINYLSEYLEQLKK